MAATLSIMGGLNSQNRSNAFRFEKDELIVDTVIPFDTQTWETGISKDNGEKWTIVEQYESEDKAKPGHEKWVKAMQKDPNKKLSDINVWNPR